MREVHVCQAKDIISDKTLDVSLDSADAAYLEAAILGAGLKD